MLASTVAWLLCPSVGAIRPPRSGEHEACCRLELVLKNRAVSAERVSDDLQSLLVPDLLVRQVGAAFRLHGPEQVAEHREGAARLEGVQDALGRGPPLLPTPTHARPTPLGGGRLREDQQQEAREATLLVATTLEERDNGFLHRLDLHPVALDELGEDVGHGVGDLRRKADLNDDPDDVHLALYRDSHGRPDLDPVLGLLGHTRAHEALDVVKESLLVNDTVWAHDLVLAQLPQQRVERVRVGELPPGVRPQNGIVCWGFAFHGQLEHGLEEGGASQGSSCHSQHRRAGDNLELPAAAKLAAWAIQWAIIE
eukprot:CAMPEP_0204521178 /NCGR_PEP_ID=MMETSP0661-20131031/5650_1 /ASSEMBLY_ACC=CAM_ASM_000606 /TAXON_ID=109239 /ORGANISM="Alexandrium margalefi, Strain AMGDE01CS-322" /LENGTH=310 /DNA_ID=CAMNT_0051526763 /DNA_START=35 /DNA_END=964 /DNA_ORIENTATION=-